MSVRATPRPIRSPYRYVRGEIHADSCEDRALLLRQWLSKHGGSKDELETYIKAFKAYRRLADKPTGELVKEMKK